MKNILYTLLSLSLIVSACKKEDDDNNTPTTVSGCMDELATNYDPNATTDCAEIVGGTDTSCCEYPSAITGCMDSIAANYNPLALEDDESCDYRVTGGKWIQVSQSYDLEITLWLDENQTIFIGDTLVSGYTSDIYEFNIQQLKFFTNGDVKTYDFQGTTNEEGTWSENQEGTLNHTITIIDAIDGEQIIFNVDNISKEQMYLNQDLDELEYEPEDNMWVQYVGTQSFSFERDENQ